MSAALTAVVFGSRKSGSTVEPHVHVLTAAVMAATGLTTCGVTGVTGVFGGVVAAPAPAAGWAPPTKSLLSFLNVYVLLSLP